MSDLLLIGLNHTRAPVDVRECLAFADEEKGPFLRALAERGLAQGAVLLSTCNRVELYADVPEGADSGALLDLLESWRSPGRPFARDLFYVHRNREAVAHLFRVASGLDSMILGEPQIFGQVKDAYFLARDAGSVSAPLNLLFQKAFHVAKQVRTETGIGQRPVTVSYAAFNLARGIFADLSQKRILLLGAGEMSRIVATHFVDHGVQKVKVANRTLERAREFASAFGAEVVPWEDFPKALIHSDIVISSTGAPRPIILRAMAETVMKLRRWASLFLVDIAVPRDVEPEVGDLDGVYLYNIDSLQQVADEGLEERKGRAAEAEAMIASELDLYARFLEHRQLSEVIQGLMGWVGRIQEAEVEEAFRKLGPLTSKQQEVVRNAVRRTVHKVLHAPITQVKRLVLEEEAAQALQIFKQLFPAEGGDEREES
ncbi:MAG: glutamyl-tRNA reductase [Acidobacteriota bacterium]